jgi:hypothetical protein
MEGGERLWCEISDVGQLGEQDGGRDLAEAGDGAHEGEIIAQDGISGDKAAHCVHDGLDLRVEPGNMGRDGRCHGSRSEAGLLSVELLDAGCLERVAAADQLAKLTQVRGRRRPCWRDLGTAEAGD